MADEPDKDEKTEDPTQKKLSEAREQGSVPKSQEVNNWLILFATAMYIAFLGEWTVVSISNIVRGFIAYPELMLADEQGLLSIIRQLMLALLGVLWVPFAIFAVTGVVASLSQTGFIFSGAQMAPDLSKLSPKKGLKKIFGKEAIVEFLKALGKLSVIGSITYLIAVPVIKNASTLVGEDIIFFLPFLQELALKLLVGVLAVLFVIAVLDFMYQKYKHFEEMKMTKQEVKDERKQMDGDPKVKARLKQLRVKKAMQRMMQKVPEADVVITNPIHFANALQYTQGEMDAPVLVAKGQDEVALRIREVAEEHGVPIVENPPLARALFASVEIDEEIPEEHYKAVAEVISYIFSLNNKNK